MTDEAYEQAKRDYGKALAKLSGAEIRQGLDLCEAECRYPPSPAEFGQLARRKGLENGINGQAYRVARADRLLERKRTTEQTAVGLESIRRIKRDRGTLDRSQMRDEYDKLLSQVEHLRHG